MIFMRAIINGHAGTLHIRAVNCRKLMRGINHNQCLSTVTNASSNLINVRCTW